jgi:hypothetical protein
VKLDLAFLWWLGRFALAVMDWLKDVGPETHQPIEQLPPGHPDAQPSPPRPSKPLLPHGDDWLKRAMKGRKAKR